MKTILLSSLNLTFLVLGASCTTPAANQNETTQKTELSNKDKAVAVLNSLNTGDQTALAYINPNEYIQRNSSIADDLDELDAAFYDLFRSEDGLVVEHWDTIQTIPTESEWKNSNGKF